MALKLKKSWFGFTVAGIFFLLAMLALAAHLYSIETNVGDSGESAVIMMPFVLPWVLWLPDSVAYSGYWGMLAYPLYVLVAVFNAFLLYCLFGGLWPQRKPTEP